MRRLISTTLLCLTILLAVFSGPAVASIAWIASNHPMQGVRADITTPSSRLSGIVSYTTVKGNLGAQQNTNTGFLVRPPTYPDPQSYYVWYDSNGIATEVILSSQSYNTSRAYKIANLDTGYLWYIYIVTTFRHTSNDVYDNGTVTGGATTSNSTSNIWSRYSTFQGSETNPASSWYNFVDNSASIYDSDPAITSPLAINIYSANYSFAAYKP